jgi:hypothetical protein
MSTDNTLKKYDVKAANNIALGQNGATTETGTTVLTGNWVAIQFLADTVFTTLTDTTGDGDDMKTVTYLTGMVIFGQFTAITLASGAIRAYKGTPNVT